MLIAIYKSAAKVQHFFDMRKGLDEKIAKRRDFFCQAHPYKHRETPA